jgi:DNA-binding response OmpR family regulator
MGKIMRILIVDDESTIADIIAETLDQEGHTTVTANGGFHALQLVETQRPEIILLDLMMYPMSGQDVLKKLVEQGTRSSYRVIVMSAGINLPQEAARIGADGFLAKPFDLDDLDALIHRNDNATTVRSFHDGVHHYH